jgi:hypothetical protein
MASSSSLAAERKQEEVKVQEAESVKFQDRMEGERDRAAKVDDVGEENRDRRFVVHPQVAIPEPEEDADEEFVFEDESPQGGMQVGWLALARYYSSRNFPAKVLFADLFRIWGEGTARALGNNRFLLEFGSKKCLNFVLRGGPWTFRGDAVIVVHYDGLTRLSACWCILIGILICPCHG